jgi:hypothetical protein
MRKQRLGVRKIRVLGFAATMALGVSIVAALPAQASGTPHITGILYFMPPANSATSTSTARLQQDWHSSRLSGDPNAVGTCTPGSSYFPSYCSALDWNKGTGAVGDPVYLRLFGVWSNAGSSSSFTSAVVSAQKTTTCGSGPTITIHYVTVQIKNSSGSVVGTLVFQHVKPSATTVKLTVAPSPGYFNNVQIGTMTSDVSSTGTMNTGCWTGAHVHEDDLHDGATNDSQWFWNTSRFQGKAGTAFRVEDSSNNWTRGLTWWDLT